MPGGHSGEVIPVPIPNTEVKLSYADDTAAKWESRSLPGFFYFKVSLCVEAFFVLKLPSFVKCLNLFLRMNLARIGRAPKA